ncbi:hypothetical protein LNP20_25180 [Klebsiella pneumoniae subsp. pneumoniae]|nr:hypothetical protein [Klebsiella pneumoniae subsp. pneumoniae]
MAAVERCIASQQALFGDSRDRLRLAVRVDIAGADARRQRGIIEAFTSP